MIRGDEPKASRAFLIDNAADSQNRAKRPPRPEKSERKRGNRDQHSGAEKKIADTGARAEQRKPRSKKTQPRGAGGNHVQKRENCERVVASNEETKPRASEDDCARNLLRRSAPLSSSMIRAAAAPGGKAPDDGRGGVTAPGGGAGFPTRMGGKGSRGRLVPQKP